MADIRRCFRTGQDAFTQQLPGIPWGVLAYVAATAFVRGLSPGVFRCQPLRSPLLVGNCTICRRTRMVRLSAVVCRSDVVPLHGCASFYDDEVSADIPLLVLCPRIVDSSLHAAVQHRHSGNNPSGILPDREGARHGGGVLHCGGHAGETVRHCGISLLFLLPA